MEQSLHLAMGAKCFRTGDALIWVAPPRTLGFTPPSTAEEDEADREKMCHHF